jgi:glutaredoxin
MMVHVHHDGARHTKPSRLIQPTIIMKTKATFYHAGCPVCVSAEQSLLQALDRSRYEVTNIHLGQTPELLPEAQRAGVKSVPAIMLGGEVLHLNFGASLQDLKQPA